MHNLKRDHLISACKRIVATAIVACEYSLLSSFLGAGSDERRLYSQATAIVISALSGSDSAFVFGYNMIAAGRYLSKIFREVSATLVISLSKSFIELGIRVQAGLCGVLTIDHGLSQFRNRAYLPK